MEDLETAIPHEPRLTPPTFTPPSEMRIARDDFGDRAVIITVFLGVARTALKAMGYADADMAVNQHPWNGRTEHHILVVRGIPAFEVEVRASGPDVVFTSIVIAWPAPASAAEPLTAMAAAISPEGA